MKSILWKEWREARMKLIFALGFLLLIQMLRSDIEFEQHFLRSLWDGGNYIPFGIIASKLSSAILSSKVARAALRPDIHDLPHGTAVDACAQGGALTGAGGPDLGGSRRCSGHCGPVATPALRHWHWSPTRRCP